MTPIIIGPELRPVKKLLVSGSLQAVKTSVFQSLCGLLQVLISRRFSQIEKPQIFAESNHKNLQPATCDFEPGITKDYDFLSLKQGFKTE